jgi:hypothetical protein
MGRVVAAEASKRIELLTREHLRQIAASEGSGDGKRSSKIRMTAATGNGHSLRVSFTAEDRQD